MLFPSLYQLLAPRLPPFRFYFYLPLQVGSGGQDWGCWRAATTLRPRPHPPLGLPGSLWSQDTEPTTTRPTADLEQTHTPSKEGRGGAGAGWHVTRPLRRKRRHVSSLLPHLACVRTPTPRLPPTELGEGLGPRLGCALGRASARARAFPGLLSPVCALTWLARPATSSSLPESFSLSLL